MFTSKSIFWTLATRPIRVMRTSLVLCLITIVYGCGADKTESAEHTFSASDATSQEQDSSVATTQDEESPSGSSNRPVPVVGLEPTDLSSGIDVDSGIQIVLFAVARQVTHEEVESVRTSLYVEDESGRALSFQTAIETEPTGTLNPGLTRTFIRVLLDEPLAEGWNKLVLSAMPNGWAPATYNWAPSENGGGLLIARLSPDSTPVLRTVTLCDKKVRLDFSQEVDVSGANIRIGDASCTRSASDDMTTTILLNCLKRPLDEAEIEIELTGLRSKDGTAAAIWNDSGAVDTSVILSTADFGSGSPEGDGCRDYRF